MYTILINNDLSLTTSVKTTLLRNTSTDEIWFLYNDPSSDLENDVSDDTLADTQVIVQKTFSAALQYYRDDIIKSEDLTIDPELYKGKYRFILPRNSSFFSNVGVTEVWLDIEVVTTTITKTIDPDTGAVIDTDIVATSDEFSTLSTPIFIDSVIKEKNYPCRRYGRNAIHITRGDSLTVTVSLVDNDGYPYEPVLGDVVLFTVKKSATAADILIQKNIDIDTLTLELVESDTENLAFGEYKYEVEVITTTNDHYTVIKNAPFIITEELH